MTDPTFGQLLGQLILQKRRAAGLTQTQLSEDAFGSAAKVRRISELETGSVSNPHPTTVDPIIAVLEITKDEIETCAKRSGAKLDADLDRAYREARNLIEALAYRFEHSEPDASFADLDEFLRSKAQEWQALRDRLQKIDGQNREIEKLKNAADDALSAGNFDEVDRLLASLEEQHQLQRTLEEVEKQASIRISRGDACLLRDDFDEAIKHYASASDFFVPFDEQRSLETLETVAHGIYESSLRSIRPRFQVAATLLDKARSLAVAKQNPEKLGALCYRLSLILRNQYIKSREIEAVEKAIKFARRSLEAFSPNLKPFEYICSQISLANCLGDMARAKNDDTLFEESISVLKSAKVLALEHDQAESLLGCICNSLGSSMLRQELLPRGSDVIDDADEIMAEFQAAIKFSEKCHQLDVWGAAKLNIARLLAGQAEREIESQVARLALRIRAISEFQAALETYPETAFPDRFGQAHFELGSVLFQHAMEIGGTLSEVYLFRTIQSFETACMISPREIEPVKWATIQMYIGAAFARHGQLEGITSQEHDFQQALDRYSFAFEVFKEQGLSDLADQCARAIQQAKIDLRNSKTSEHT